MARKRIPGDELERIQMVREANARQGQALPPPLRDLPQGLPTLPQGAAGADPAATLAGAEPVAQEGTIIGSKEVAKAAEILREYKKGKQALEQRIIENEQWYRTRHWDYINRKYGNARQVTDEDGTQVKVPKNPVEPTSSWLFNALANKHADVMDNYPAPIILPRERNDEEAAKTLSAIIPVIIERNDFERTYSNTAWDELKSGTSIIGVFWNPELENGLGDIDIKEIDILNVFWQPGITDIQQSRNLFIVSLVDNDVLEAQYPQLKGKLHSANSTINVADYIYDDTIDTSQKTAVIDWYYKRRSATGKTILHFCKFVGETVLFASENDPRYQERGWYDHGRYPVEFDVLFPAKGSPCGFGFVDIMREPQLYIDKLNQILLTNAFMAGRSRWFIKDNGGVNEKEFSDFSRDFVHVAGSLSDDNLRQIEVKPLPNSIQELLAFKVNELKETSGSRDFNQGGTTSGVTAAAAIAALQEAGNKLSRDLIKGRYRAFRGVITLCIELIRQFYDEAREFRIVGDRGQVEFTSFSNATIRDQILPPAVPGEELQPGYVPSVRRPIFDVIVKAEKTNPFSRASQNELAKELYSMGFFDPARADQALAALEIMDFDGKEKVVERISRGQTLLNIIMQQQAEMQKMALLIQNLTGVEMPGGQTGATEQTGKRLAEKPPPKSSDGQAQTLSYADALAKRSVPDMSRLNQGVQLK